MEIELKRLEAEYLELLILRSEPNEMYSSSTMDKMISDKRQEICNLISSSYINIDALIIILKECFDAGGLQQKAIDNTITRIEKRLPYDKDDLNVKTFNQWCTSKASEINKLCCVSN